MPPVNVTGPLALRHQRMGAHRVHAARPRPSSACREADVVLSGAVGTHPGVTAALCPNPEAALIELRHIFDLRISVRTVRVPGEDDVIIVRNITGGAYARPDQRIESDGVRVTPRTASCSTRIRVQEVFDIAVDYARAHPGRRSMSVDKASVYRHLPAVATHVARHRGRDRRRVRQRQRRPRRLRARQVRRTCPPSSSPRACSATSSPTSSVPAPDPRRCADQRRSTRTAASGHGITALFEPAHGSSPHRTGSRRSNPTGAWLALVDLLAWCPDLAALGLHTRVARTRSTMCSTPAPRPTTSPTQARQCSILTSSIRACSTNSWRLRRDQDHAQRPFAASAAVRRVAAASLRTAQPTTTPALISLAMGEPGFDTPPAIRLTAHASIETGYTHYAHPHGDPELRDALAALLNREHGTGYTSNDVLITHGGTGGLAAAILAVVNPGDRVVIPDPTYSLYADLIRLAGGEPVTVPLQQDLHWDLDALADALAGARAFVFCNPSNPTGIVHTRDELDAVAEMLADSDTLVLSDEAYSELVYTGTPFVSALDLPALAERTLYCQTFSKAYAMTGWRLGYLAGNPDVIAAAARVHELTAGPLNPATQRAALTAVHEPPAELTIMREQYHARRNLMVAGLAAVPGLDLAAPDGAFYAFPRYEADLTAPEMVAHLHSHGVAVRPGSEFGAAGEHHIRLSFAADPAAITQGIARLRAGLATL